MSIHPSKNNAINLLINDHVNLKTFAFTVKLKGWGQIGRREDEKKKGEKKKKEGL